MLDGGTECADRVGHYLRQQWPRHTAKEAARAFDVDERTVKGWLAGTFPKSPHFRKMVKAWGWRFLSFVFEPVAGALPSEMELALEIEETQDRLDALNARRKERRSAREADR